MNYLRFLKNYSHKIDWQKESNNLMFQIAIKHGKMDKGVQFIKCNMEGGLQNLHLLCKLVIHGEKMNLLPPFDM
jgi:hypothetical protein